MECSQCMKTLVKNCIMKRYMFKHMGKRFFRCLQCQKKLEPNIVNLVGARKFLQVRTFKCLLCRKTLPGRSYLMQHVAIHTVEKMP